MDKQEVIKHIQKALRRELLDICSDGSVNTIEAMQLERIHKDIMKYLDNNLRDSVPESLYDRTISPPKTKEGQCYSVLTDSYNTGKLGVDIGVTAPKQEQQFTQTELKQLLDIIVSLMLYISHSNSPVVAPEVKILYKKILEMF